MPLVREAFPWFIIVLPLSILLWRQLVVKQASSPGNARRNGGQFACSWFEGWIG